MTRLREWHEPFTSVTWLIYVSDVTHLFEWHDSFSWVTWLIYVSDMTHLREWQDSFSWVTRIIYVSDVTWSHAWRDSFTWVAWLNYVSNMMNSYEQHVQFECGAMKTVRLHLWYDSFTFVTELIYVSGITHFVTWVPWLIYVRVTRIIYLSNMTPSYEQHDSFTWEQYDFTVVQKKLRVNICDMTHLHEWQESFIRASWLIHVCDITHIIVHWTMRVCIFDLFFCT